MCISYEVGVFRPSSGPPSDSTVLCESLFFGPDRYCIDAFWVTKTTVPVFISLGSLGSILDLPKVVLKTGVGGSIISRGLPRVPPPGSTDQKAGNIFFTARYMT